MRGKSQLFFSSPTLLEKDRKEGWHTMEGVPLLPVIFLIAKPSPFKSNLCHFNEDEPRSGGPWFAYKNYREEKLGTSLNQTGEELRAPGFLI